MENKFINNNNFLEIENSPFVIKGAIGRLYFVLNGLLLSLTTSFVVKLVSNASDDMQFGLLTGILSILALIFAFYCIVLYFVNIKKRVTAIRGSVDWAYILLAWAINFIPLVNSLLFIVLAVIPNHKAHNITYHST